MVKNYIKRNLMLLGAAAFVATASAAGHYQDVTGKYLQNPAFIPGWQGALTATSDGVAEIYNGAFNLYQTLNDMPAGEYTLKVNAFYRCGNNDYSKAHMDNGANHYAYIYINGQKKAVEGLFDNHKDAAPNSRAEANASFEKGEYVNEVKYTLTEPGDLVVGIMNEGCYNDEWCCFDNFQLFCGSEDVTSKIKNADFAQGLDANPGVWEMTNSGNSVKKPDVDKHGGVYRKTNASAYNFGQQVELPAGKYRFSVLSFLRYGGAGNYNGKIITCKGQWGLTDSESPRDWYDNNSYDKAIIGDNAYLYMSVRAAKPTKMTTSGFGHQINLDTDVLTRIPALWQLFEGKYDEMPENETRGTADGQEIVPPYETRNVVPGWGDSGSERESAAAFVANPDKFRVYCEFELKATTKVWLGLAKDENRPAQYWNPFADFKLEQYVEGAGVDDVIADDTIDENAPVEYYNLQGVRVENPTNGLYIKVQGTKATKVIVRN